MKLYEIADSIERILSEWTNPDTGEILDGVLHELEMLEMALDEKALAVAAYLIGERVEAEAIAKQAERLHDRARVHLNRAKRLEDYLASHIEPGRKLSDARVAISWRKSQRVEVDEESKLEDRFVRVVVKREPDKVAIREAMDAGEEVKHARLVERTSLVVK